jgi:hypothetical protein
MPSPVGTPRITGKLDANGIASFEVDEFASHGQSSGTAPPQSLKAALDGARDARRNGGGNTPDSASEEDYDTLEPDPLAVIVGGKGGGFHRDGRIKDSREGPNAEDGSDLQTSRRSKPIPPKLKSIPITLKKADQKGRYYLIAEDAELREILKGTVERVGSANGINREFTY